jgi:hypothetical protein
MLMCGVGFSKLKCSNCTKDVQKLNSSCTKKCACGGNCITGNVERVLWNMEVASLILRRFSAQEHDRDNAVL